MPSLGANLRGTTQALVNPGRVSASRAARRAASALVVFETALAIVLLTAAGLVLRSFARLIAIDPGFTIDHVLTFDLAIPGDRYRTPEARHAFFARAFGDIRQVRGVESAGAAAVTPLTGNNWTVPFDRSDRPVPAGQRPPDVGWQAASAGYFEALRIPLTAGRLFDDRDRPDGPPVVIISQSIRDRFFPGEDPIGRKVRSGDGDAEIVGVVGDIHRAALTDQPRADLYFPLEQGPQTQTTIFVRTKGDPRDAAGEVRRTLHRIEPQSVTRRMQTLRDIAGESVQITRLALWLLGLFAVSALALAAVGIYGVMSYAVRQRTREIGTRMALGASPAQIQWMVMRDGVLTGAIGAAIGLAAGLASARALSTLLYRVSPADPLTLAAATAVLLAVAMLACYVPARRATRVDPVRTLSA